jgi:hypothetical protein
LFTVDRIAKPVPNAALRLEDQESEDPEKQDLFLQCLTPVWHRDIHVFAMQKEEYSNEAHFSSVLAAIQYSETLVQGQDNFPLTLKPQMKMMNIHVFRTLQRSPSSQRFS